MDTSKLLIRLDEDWTKAFKRHFPGQTLFDEISVEFDYETSGVFIERDPRSIERSMGDTYKQLSGLTDSAEVIETTGEE